MIEIPTVLILGAGASHPFRFPLGSELLEGMCAALADERQQLFQQLKEYGYMADEISSFGYELVRSGQQSVDAFLEKRPEFLSIGKAAITCGLVPLENEADLINLKYKDRWYRYLFGKMDAGNLDEFRNNKLSFITFNYDRSLEHFLFLSLKHSYNKSDAETANVLQTIPIVHVYGQLGKHPYIDKEGRPYESAINKDVVDRCVAEITIVHEGDRLDTFSKAHELLGHAQKVCFLGFGYNRTNLERLQLRRVRRDPLMLGGTALGLQDAERSEVERSIKELGELTTMHLYDHDVLLMLRKHPVLS